MAIYLVSDDYYFSTGLKQRLDALHLLRWSDWTRQTTDRLFKDNDTLLLDASSADFIAKTILMPVCKYKVKTIIIYANSITLPWFFHEHHKIMKAAAASDMVKMIYGVVNTSPAIRYCPGHLTVQERKILNMIFCQLSVYDISTQLAIHPKTVSTHKNNALRKLKIRRLDQLFYNKMEKTEGNQQDHTGATKTL